MLEAIYSSKLYRSHPNKDKIKSAMQNPINTELVQQLRQYLDDEFIRPEYLGEDKKPKEGKVDKKVDKEKGPSKRSHSTPSPSPARFTPNRGLGKDDLVDETNRLSETDLPNDEEPMVPADSSTKITSTPISAACEVDSINPDEMRGTLNSREDTTGVDRILIKEKELWVYYSDKVNLNNTMGPVLEYLNAAGYTCLEFNRLARTDNAMVFDIACNSSSNMEPIESEDT